MPFDLPILRIGLYGALTLFSFILFCLCAARLNYTTHLPPSDTLNGGRPFYDPVVVELLVSTLMTMPWSLFIIYSIHTRYENKYVSTFLSEIIGLAILWLFWIAGAAVATNIWGDLTFCQQFAACQILSALLAFAWLGWIILTALLGIALLFAFANSALTEPLHGRWNPRESQYVDNVSRA
ncbi:unnamed protein product [Cyclocybe aegerita]|uniref:MARVEL domain-containing protein n=1 Tax=Cyclocybe aegerita TaxID=1973307 RepID=A0A8S0X1A6_CYCAE|nr:unnamed protein product [Cyclocybe aegerita]